MISSAFGVANLLVISMVGAGTGLPLGLPPAEQDPVLAKIAPEECLAYVSWAGSATPDGSSENHLEQLLAEPEVQLFLTEAEKLLVKAIQKAAAEEGEEATMFAKLGVTWGKKLLYNPAAFYIESFAFDPTTGPVVNGGAIVNVGDDAAELQKTLGEMLDGFGIERVEVAGVEMHQIQPEPEAPLFTIGVKEKYLYLGIGKGAVEGMVERAKTDAPKWLTTFREQVKLDRVSLIAYGNASQIVKTGLSLAAMAQPDIAEFGPEKILALLGLDNVTTVGCVCGLDESGYVTRALIGIDGASKGILTLADGKPLTAADLAPIPEDSTLAVAARFDAAKLFELVADTAGKIDPGAKEQLQAGLDEIEGDFGISVPDLLKALGDTWCLYHSTSEGGYLGGLSATVTVKDRKVFESLHKKLTDLVVVIGDRGDGGPKFRSTKFAGQTIYSLTNIERGFPLAPSWCITDERLIVSLMPQNIKAYLGRGDEFQSIATQPTVAKALADSKPIKMYYQDTPRLFEHLYVMLPMATRMASRALQEEGIELDVAIMPSGESIYRHLRPDVITVSRTAAGIEVTSRETFPGSANAISLVFAGMAGWNMASGSSDSSPLRVLTPRAAREAEAKNNLKMFGLAMHNYHDTYGHFPPAFSTDKDGKPLLSWRVLVLPYLEQDALYRKFKLDEPWDSEHNKKLIDEMPELYRAPGSKAEEGKTVYLTVRDKNSPFPGAEKLRISSITDGTSNTIMVLEANDATAKTWTKPDDFVPPMDPGAGLVGLRRKGFLAVCCDGAAHKFKETIDRDALKNIFNRRDGVAVDWQEFTERGRGRDRTRTIRVDADAFDAPPIEAIPRFDFKEELKREDDGAARAFDPKVEKIPTLPSLDKPDSARPVERP